MNERETIMVKMTLLDCAEYCRPKVAKLRPGKKSGVINGIRNAFNFKAEITDAAAEKIYGLLLANFTVVVDRVGGKMTFVKN